MTFSICLGIAVDDTIHFLTRFRAVVRAGADGPAAVQRTVQTVGLAMVVTSVILVGGFATMLFSSVPPIRTFGQLACAAMLAALVGDLFILPALILSFPREAYGCFRSSNSDSEGSDRGSTPLA